MEGITRLPGRTDMGKPYLSIQGLDWLGHAHTKRAHLPLTPHLHKGCIEITFVMDGSQTYCTEGQEYLVSSGEAFLAFMDQIHSSSNDTLDMGEIYWIQLNLTQPENFLCLNSALSFDLSYRLLEINQHVFCFSRQVRNLLKKTFKEFDNHGTTPLAISSLVYLLQLMLRTMSGGKPIQKDFIELDNYIDSHLSENLRVEDLSAICHLSTSTLQHRFKDYFGRTPAEYINYRKIQRAKELLLEGKTVTETAMLLGFNTSTYFATVFRKFNRVSPSRWAEIHGGPQQIP